jgi:hypothetical protein
MQTATRYPLGPGFAQLAPMQCVYFHCSRQTRNKPQTWGSAPTRIANSRHRQDAAVQHFSRIPAENGRPDRADRPNLSILPRSIYTRQCAHVEQASVHGVVLIDTTVE